MISINFVLKCVIEYFTKKKIFFNMNQIKVCVLIPAYNCGKTIEKVIKSVLQYTDDVIVVNDGSTDDTESILSSFEKQIILISYKRNKGKGYALKQATLSLPASAGRVNYPVITSSAPSFYIAESAGQNPASFAVTGKFDGKNASFTITLKSGGKAIDIVRNTHYQINFKPDENDVCDVTITIPEWGGVVVTDDHLIRYDSFN